MKKPRKMVLASGTWKYVVGRGCVRVVAPNGRAAVVWISTLKGISEEAFERGRWKRTRDGAVTPREVRAWIERQHA